MGQVAIMPERRGLPAHLARLVQESAWGRLGQALQDGAPANLRGTDGPTLFGATLYQLAMTGPEKRSGAAYGPLALLHTFIEEGLDPHLPEDRTTLATVLAAGQWHWVDPLLNAGFPVEMPGGRAALFDLIEGRMLRRSHGLEEDIWEEDGSVNRSRLNGDTAEDVRDLRSALLRLGQHGVDIEAIDDDEEAEYPTTPLMLAIIYDDLALVDALLAIGASLDAPWKDASDESYMSQMHPVALAAKEGRIDILRRLLDHANEDQIDLYGADAMQVAASKGRVESLRLLHERGVPITATARSGGFQVLHQAALHGNKEVIDWLLERGADWHAVSETGVSPAAVLKQYQPQVVRFYGIERGDNIVPMRPR